MKIAQVCPYDFAHPGGVASHIKTLEQYLTRMGHKIKIIAPGSDDVTFFGDRFIPIGRPVPIPVSGSIARIALSPWLAPRIKEVLAEEKFDIIHLHEPLMPILCSEVLRLSNTIIVGTFHAAEGRPGYRFGWPVSGIILKRWARKLNGKIACCQVALDYASKYIPGPYAVIPDGIDLNHFSPDVAPIETFCDGRLNILFVGRLEKRKGISFLIKAYIETRKDFPQSRLIVVSPSLNRRREFEKQLSRNGVEDIVFVGPVSDDDLPRYYKTADIFCSPATGHESFGIVLLEAMALGKPVVASRIPGHASWITHGEEGLLVLPKDTGELSRALISLMSNESLRHQMGERALATAKKYNMEQVARRISDYYRTILDESK